MNSKTLRPRRVLIIGAGFGGIACAKALSDHPKFSVTLVERENHHLFQPLLYQVATASLAAPDIACSVRQVFRDSNNVTVLMDDIQDLGITGKTARGGSGNDYPLTSDLRVVLIEASKRLLTPFDEDQSAYARKRLERLGVEIWTERLVEEVTPGCLKFQGGDTLEASNIIWAAGVEASPLTRNLGVELADPAGRVTPERDLSLSGNPDVFVIGDLVKMTDIDDKPVPGVAPAASQMGKHVAKVLKEELRLERTEHDSRKHELRPGFRYVDKGLMAIIGKNAAVVKTGGLRLQGFPAWLAWLFIHILFLIGFRSRLAVLLGWAFAYIRNNPGVRVIVHRPGEGPPSQTSSV